MKFISGTCPHLTPGKYPFSYTSGAGQSIAVSQESLNNIDVLADGKEHSLGMYCNSQFHSAFVLFRISFVIQVTWRYFFFNTGAMSNDSIDQSKLANNNGGYERCKTVQRF